MNPASGLAAALALTAGAAILFASEDAQGKDTGPTEPGKPSQLGGFPGATKEYQRLNIAGIYTLAGRLVSAGYIGPEVVDFLAIKAYTEARWSWKVGSSAQSNAARGMFGLRPQSAWDEPTFSKLKPWQFESLKDPAWAIAQALDYLSRVGPYVCDGTVNAQEMACGWAFPSLACAVESCREKRPELWTRWQLALSKSGFPGDWNPELRMSWPGLVAAHHKIVGIA